MKIGKIAESILKRSVLKQVHSTIDKSGNKAAVGADCGMIQLQENQQVAITTNPFTLQAEVELKARMAVLRGLNNLAAGGATAVGIEVCVLLPEDTEEAVLKRLMKQLAETCREQKVELLGGHTEVTTAVSRPILTVTAVGEKQVDKEAVLAESAGLDIVVTKWIGLAGTVLLAEEKKTELKERYPEAMIRSAQEFSSYLSVQEEAQIAQQAGVIWMHDLSEGGIFAGLWELAQRAGVGLDIDLKQIPIHQETVEICEFYGINPYELQSQGSLLLFAPDGNEVVRNLSRAGIAASIIGKTTDGNDRIIRNEEEERFLEPPKPDEIHSILG